MNQKVRVIISVSLMLFLAGCLFTSTPTGTTSIDFDEHGYEGAEHEFEVTLENDEGAINTVDLVIDGETVDSEEIMLPDEERSTTHTFTHTFEEQGEYDVVIDGTEETVVIESNPAYQAEQAMDDVETVQLDGSIVLDGHSDGADATGELQLDSGMNYADEEMYAYVDATVNAGDLSEEIEMSQWFVDDTLFREDPNPLSDGDLHTSSRFTDFEETGAVEHAEILSELDPEGFERQGENYVYTEEVENNNEMEAVIENAGVDDITADEIEYAEFTLVLDRDTYKIETISVESTVDTVQYGESFEGDIDVTVTYHSYNEPVEVSIPDSVADEAGW